MCRRRVTVGLQVAGDLGEGIATVEAVRKSKGVVFNLLVLDTLPNGVGGAARSPAAAGGAAKASTLILVHGKEEKLHVQGSLRGFLQVRWAHRGGKRKIESSTPACFLPPVDGPRVVHPPRPQRAHGRGARPRASRTPGSHRWPARLSCVGVGVLTMSLAAAPWLPTSFLKQ